MNALGGNAAGLGYAGIGKSVAIKFDFNNNAGEGSDSTGVYIDGASPTVPAVNMTASGVILRSGDSMLAHVTYDGTTLTMTLLDPVVNKSFTLTQVINIPQVVGANTAYVGFTGSTGGGSTASQKILYWTYAPQTPTTASATSAPTFSSPGGSYSTSQSIVLSSATKGATIYYTTNGTTPTTASTVYSSPIIVGTGTTTIEAIAAANGFSPSAVATATYIVGGTIPVNFSNGFSSTAGLALNAAATVTDDVLQLTLLGSATDKGSAWLTTPVSIAAFTSDFYFQLLSPAADGFTFTIQNQGLNAIGPGGSGLGYGASRPGGPVGIPKSVAIKFDIYSNQGEGTDSTGFYTDGASPTIPASRYDCFRRCAAQRGSFPCAYHV